MSIAIAIAVYPGPPTVNARHKYTPRMLLVRTQCAHKDLDLGELPGRGGIQLERSTTELGFHSSGAVGERVPRAGSNQGITPQDLQPRALDAVSAQLGAPSRCLERLSIGICYAAGQSSAPSAHNGLSSFINACWHHATLRLPRCGLQDRNCRFRGGMRRGGACNEAVVS
ncbi:hypothetical protein FB45DRAFT_863814 [Roridomyces roridus]|uniref:Uncharacterized protein n=1 Tax=Roridomyces roridus TaxID=1738132 RepID=A0AAD7C4Y3_9AGAR|nr:hypothetical protein FB45DRAFT_863814 [Roridomyces roridus]